MLARRIPILLRQEAVSDWYLPGGVVAGDCLGAYRGKGAASLAASLVNLANPGTYNLTVNYGIWLEEYGWKNDQFDVTNLPAGNVKSWVLCARPSAQSDDRIALSFSQSSPLVVRSWGVQLQGTGWRFVLNDGNYRTKDSPNLTVNSYYALGASQVEYYVNGNSIGTNPVSSFAPDSGGRFGIGYNLNWNGTAYNSLGSFYGYGWIACAAFYAVELSAAQQAALSAAMLAL